MEGQAPESATQMPGETNSQSPDPHTGPERDKRQTETADAPREQTAVSPAARKQQVMDKADAWDTDEGDDL